jgi:hypothetical protein
MIDLANSEATKFTVPDPASAQKSENSEADSFPRWIIMVAGDEKTDSIPCVRKTAMTTVDECLEYARECLRWAAEAKTEYERHAFFKMARAWTSATLLASDDDPARPQAHHRRSAKNRHKASPGAR